MDAITSEWPAFPPPDVIGDLQRAREAVLKNMAARPPFDRIGCTQAFFDKLAAWVDAIADGELVNAPLTVMLMGFPLAVRPDAEVHRRGWQPERRGKKPGEWEVIPV